MQILSKKEYYNSLAKKPMGSDVVFFNDKHELLLVKPSYKDEWLMPGGACEAGESPLTCAKRETLEEIGLDIEIKELLCIDYGITREGDNLKFIFFGGILNEEQIASIRLQEEELTEYRFVSLKVASGLLGPKKIKRMPHCLEAIKNNKAVYLENGMNIY